MIKTKKTAEKKEVKVKVSNKITVQAKREREVFEPDSWYIAKFVRHAIEDGKFENPYVRLVFEFTKHPDNVTESGRSAAGMKMDGIFGLPCSQGTRTYEMISILAGSELDIGDDIELKAFYGKTVQVFVENSKRKDDDGKYWQRIAKIRPLKKKVKK